ncbi:MAG: hypothetical protein SFY68_15905, partial [Candidatus Sumerlaeia bacterium]|nr:hypothetical protein [Candidatus Sumerlaeia bacterium]
MQELKEAKHLIFIGYSMPETDKNMSFFLKAALGDNQSLRRIFVFDPALHNEDERAKQMEDRFRACFSKKMQSRIEFRRESNNSYFRDGTLAQFAHILKSSNNLLFKKNA